MATITNRTTTPVSVRNEDLTITDTGRVVVDSNNAAVFARVDSGNISIVNDGSIVSQSSNAMNIRAGEESSFEVHNSGLIKGEYGVRANVINGDDPLMPTFSGEIVNNGKIVGTTESAIYLQGQDDIVINHGVIHGNVSLDLEKDDDGNDDLDAVGNDFYKGSGNIAGDLNTGAGNDRIDHAGLITQNVYAGDGDDVLIVRDGGRIRGETDMGDNSSDSDQIINKGRMESGVFFGDGDDSYRGISNGFAASVLGGEGNDTLRGSNNADTFWGGDGQDVLIGGAGGDNLDGGFGNDVLFGGPGSDFLTGGDGFDRFVFAPGDGNDFVTDFETGDTLDLRAFDLISFDNVEAVTRSNEDITVIRLEDTRIVLENYTELSSGDVLL
ncbi:hypothetical protein L1787_04990 [Acuticoccus sp. M5D2P5]|uniref:calcium-binding protein n=1 Tax=Acuticoccus kalidii TaxID=2910977 RepID=UPI001F21256A|nr:calcium-binding protein [Acuticoccus kalidii]MCF3932770.1 hypothetical protein [Acuticoccus kalidii]